MMRPNCSYEIVTQDGIHLTLTQDEDKVGIEIFELDSTFTEQHLVLDIGMGTGGLKLVAFVRATDQHNLATFRLTPDEAILLAQKIFAIEAARAKARAKAKPQAKRSSPEAIAAAKARSTPEAIAIRKALRATPEWIAADKARRNPPEVRSKFLPMVDGPPGCFAHLAPGKAAQ